ncbi:unnamed protein product, partial [Chrysoparadoxa australica]
MSKIDFIIIGERRSGTSTLAKWIETHPELYLYPKVDQAFFIDNPLRRRRTWLDGQIDPMKWTEESRISDYLDLFKDCPDNINCKGEKSADYLFWDSALHRIKQHIPEAKFIVTLRNPVERAWSHYWNEVGKGREKKSFEIALKEENSRSLQSDYAKLHLSYFARGKYSESISKWFDQFPRNQFHFVVLEELIENPKEELKKLYSFLEIDPNKGYENAGVRFNHNWTTVPRKIWKTNAFTMSIESNINRVIKKLIKSIVKDGYRQKKIGPKIESITRKPQKSIKMDSETRKNLIEAYKPSIVELEKILDRKINV